MSDFWWGTGASSTQTEGVAPAADWAAWEDAGRAPRSGDGNGFGGRYGEDFRLYAEHGLIHHRLSLEWARLEPHQGEHDPSAVEHYRDVLTAARDAGVAIWACLHHFTLPGWFAHDERGFVDDHSRGYYWARHVDWVGETFGDLVFGWKPVNEPAAFAGAGWLTGDHPPGRTDVGAFFEALEASHLAAHEAWRLLAGNGQPVATVHNLSPLYAADDRPETAATLDVVDEVYWRSWMRMLTDGVLQVPGRPPIERAGFSEAWDLIGFSYYGAQTVHADASTTPYPRDGRVGPLGYAPWSEGLRITLDRLDEAGLERPLVVAEHGVGTDDDRWRCDVLRDSLDHLAAARADGIDVRGFFFWTGVDNYEWTHGFTVPFGLFDRDRNPRPSASLAHAAADAGAPDEPVDPADTQP